MRRFFEDDDDDDFVEDKSDEDKEEEFNNLRHSFHELQTIHNNYVDETIRWKNSFKNRMNEIIERDREEYSILEDRHYEYVDRTNRTIQELNDEIDRYKEDQFQNSLDYRRLRNDYDDLLDEKYDLKNEVNKLRKMKTETQNDYYNLQNTYNNYQNQTNGIINFLNNELYKFKSAYEINLGKFYDLNAQYTVLWQERDSLLQINSDLNNKIAELRQLLNQKEIELNDLKQKYEKQIKYNYTFDNFNNNVQINVKFVTMKGGEAIFIQCYEYDIFTDVEEKLFLKLPHLRGKYCNYISNGNKIEKNKTVKENRIISDSPVLIIPIENNDIDAVNNMNTENYETNITNETNNYENYDYFFDNNINNNIVYENNLNNDVNFYDNNLDNINNNYITITNNNDNIFNNYVNSTDNNYIFTTTSYVF